MIICVSGPYSAETDEKRQENLDRLNAIAAQVSKMGHIPIVGVNAALPIAKLIDEKNAYSTIMAISLAVTSCCDALLLVSESPGANRERDLLASKGLPIYYSIEEIPMA